MEPQAQAGLAGRFDAVVMLTQSDWFTEPVSNRYHYATRFARHLPVIFVQPDVYGSGYRFEASGQDNITLLHVAHEYSDAQTQAITAALYAKGIVRPLVWVYNPRFYRFVCGRAAPLKVYHAAEDYVNFKGIEDLLEGLQKMLPAINLVVAVSARVRDNLARLGGSYRSIVLQNGCDYSFWSLTAVEQEQVYRSSPAKRVIYQGNINRRLDIDLLDKLAGLLPDFEFMFCGRLTTAKDGFKALLKRRPNIVHTGELPLRDVREKCLTASVGLIPFVQSDEVYSMLPLKCFEYMATGLPVVSNDFEALHQFGDLFCIAQTPQQFAQAIQDVYQSRTNEAAVHRRMDAAKTMDYDQRFAELLDTLDGLDLDAYRAPRLRVNILYDEGTQHVYTVKGYLGAFAAFSGHEITYTPATGDAACQPGELDGFDVVAIFYSVRVNYLYSAHNLSPAFEKAVAAFGGHKILFSQDEYESTDTLRRSIERLGIRTVFTVVPQPYIEQVFPQKRFSNVRFISIFTGYISDEMLSYPKRPIARREVLIGYRGKDLGYWYGALTMEKLEIGVKMRRECENRGLDVDIEWTGDKRIYEDKWLAWMGGCKATLATESGSNVFDDKEKLHKKAEKLLVKNPDYPFEVFHRKYLRRHEGKVRMNQISPKMLEAVCLKTALVMYEGEYSGVLVPGRHYIVLKKDFSNIDEVLAKVQDDAFLQGMVDVAFEEIGKDPKLGYRWLIELFDDCAYAGCYPRGAGQTVKRFKYKLWAFQEFFRRDAIQIFVALVPEGTRRFKVLRWLYLNTLGRVLRRNAAPSGQEGTKGNE